MPGFCIFGASFYPSRETGPQWADQIRNGLVSRSWPKLPPGPWPQINWKLVAQRQHLFFDRADQRFMVTAGQVGPADRAAKQHIADMGEFVGLVDKNHVARCAWPGQ